MTFPPLPVTTPVIGSAPTDANDYNVKLGFLLKQFISIKTQINQWQAWQAGVNLADRYGFTAGDAALASSAINGLDAELDAVDMTFINQLAGP
jgi:hypothetical protein